MSEIKWEPVEAAPQSVPRGKPYVRVTSNAITFNAAAAGLVEDIGQYPWAVVQVGVVDGEPAVLSFRFVRQQQAGAFPVKKQSKNHKGVTFFSRDLVKRYFKLSGVGLVFLIQEVEKLDDTTLAVRLITEKGAVEELGLGELKQELDNLF